MSKYIIDVGDAYVRHGLERTLTIPVRINEHEDHWMDTRIPVTPYTEPDTEKVREEAYEQGLSDAWEAARKIANMPYDEEEKAFGSGGWTFIEKHTASEAIEKIRQYEQKQEERLEVGDEVRNVKNGWTAVVSNIDGECMTLMDTNGALGDGYDVNRFTKTGRHFPEIAAVLEKMRGEKDG